MPVATREPADHIAQLLEFAHHLESSGQDPEPFVEKYLRPWARRFCRKVRADTRYAYFAVLSECLEHFLYPRHH
jgi:TorA maturation chaperone TorD